MSIGIGTTNSGNLGIGTSNTKQTHSIVNNGSIGIGSSDNKGFNTEVSGNLAVTGISGQKTPWYKKIFGK